MKKSLLPVIFWALVGVFLVIVSQMFIPAVTEILSGSVLFLVPFIIFSLLGIALIFLTAKARVEGKDRKFLLLTGFSSAGFFVFVFLHNAFYALGTITEHIFVLKYLMQALDVAFFVVAVIVCPLGFLVGAVGSMVLFIKKRKK